MVWIRDLSYLLEWKRVSLFDRFGYVEMTKSLTIKMIPLCRLCSGGQLISIRGSLYNMGGIATYSCLHDWTIYFMNALFYVLYCTLVEQFILFMVVTCRLERLLTYADAERDV
jgi:hypothetical protein